MAYLKECYGDFDLNVDPANTVGLQLTVTDANDGGDDGGTLLDTSASSPASFSSTNDVMTPAKISGIRRPPQWFSRSHRAQCVRTRLNIRKLFWICAARKRKPEYAMFKRNRNQQYTEVWTFIYVPRKRKFLNPLQTSLSPNVLQLQRFKICTITKILLTQQALWLTLVATQHDTRIDSDSFLCVAPDGQKTLKISTTV